MTPSTKEIFTELFRDITSLIRRTNRGKLTYKIIKHITFKLLKGKLNKVAKFVKKKLKVKSL